MTKESVLVIGNAAPIYPQGGEDMGKKGIDPVQREINKAMGISDEIFLKYSCKASDFKSPLISDAQREINKVLGISDEQFLEYHCKTPAY